MKKYGQPYGIRDASGYLLFFRRVQKYSGQEQRYAEELASLNAFAAKIMSALAGEDAQK